MEATGVVLRQPLRFPPSCGGGRPDSRELRRRFKSIGFRDQAHLKYYDSIVAPSSPATAATGAKTMKEGKAAKRLKKKQLKLLKGLFRDLSTLSHLSFGSESDGALPDQLQGNLISEASELLLKQLEKVKAEEKQLKREMKEEKARLKASMSSGSSSSSSDSECGEIVDMNGLKKQVIEEATTLAYPVPIIPGIAAVEPNGLEVERASSCDSAENEASEKGCLKKIEVCIGGKCKKSGAGALLEEFQKSIGVDGVVSGCKCMGKCREGPNVKVSDKSVRAPGSNSLYIGVGLDDVDLIVGSVFGRKGNQIGCVAAC